MQARDAFIAATRLAADLRWSEALERFEASAKLRRHAGTTYNIALCQRALGHYTRAARSFREALARGDELAPSLREDARAVLAEVERVLASLEIRLAPSAARIAIDGRPLSPGGEARFVAGLREPGPPESVRRQRFSVVVDPGTHLITLSRPGYADVVRRVDAKPGSKTRLKLELNRLPASLSVLSNRERAAVSIDGVDVGTAPVTLSRPAGTYQVQVRQSGFDSYLTETQLNAGEAVTLRAVLKEEQVALSERWWFWAGIGVLAAGVAVTTYAVTRPEPDRPPLNGGSLGWTVSVP